MGTLAKVCQARRSRVPVLLFFCHLVVLPNNASLAVSAKPAAFSFSLRSFQGASEQFTSLGDARVDSNVDAVQLSGSERRTAGRFLFGKAVALQSSHSYGKTFASFSTAFSFSMIGDTSGTPGDGFAFVLVPDNVSVDWGSLGLVSLEEMQEAAAGWVHRRSAPQVFAVEFDCYADPEFLDPNDNHVGVDVESLVSVATANASDVGVHMRSGRRLFAWIDYDAFRKLLEVRLGKDGTSRPSIPLLAYDIDLRSLVNDNMYVGFSSSAGDNPLKHFIHSWCFGIGRGETGYPFRLCDFQPMQRNVTTMTAKDDTNQQEDDDVEVENSPVSTSKQEQENTSLIPVYRDSQSMAVDKGSDESEEPFAPVDRRHEHNVSPDEDRAFASPGTDEHKHASLHPVPMDTSQEKRATEAALVHDDETQLTNSTKRRSGQSVVLLGSLCVAMLSLSGFVAYKKYHVGMRERRSNFHEVFRQPGRFGYQELITTNPPFV